MHVDFSLATFELTEGLGLQVGGVHFNLLSKVRRDIGETLSLDRLIDSIFPTFRTNIEPDLHHAQVLHFNYNTCNDGIFSAHFYDCKY